MVNIFWPKALKEACFHAYHPGLHSQTPESIVSRFVWHWGNYPSDMWPVWESLFIQGRDDDGHFAQNIFSFLQKAVTEGQEEDRVFALFLLGALATPEARNLLNSFLASSHRKERWASAISLGRLKEEHVFSLLQSLLLEGFMVNEVFAHFEELQAAQETCRLYRGTFNEQKRATVSQAYWDLIDHLKNIDYEWYMHQRSECALVLGMWGNDMAVPKLREALQAAWKMEQDWPDYEGPDESGPSLWHFFQDHLVFALGWLGDWNALSSLRFPATHLLVARIYLILGALQVSDPAIFWGSRIINLFCDSAEHLQGRISMEKAGIEVDPFVEPNQVKQLLATHFGLSLVEQEEYLVRFPNAWYERAEESRLTRPPA